MGPWTNAAEFVAFLQNYGYIYFIMEIIAP
jgi:hypothetical protein